MSSNIFHSFSVASGVSHNGDDGSQSIIQNLVSSSSLQNYDIGQIIASNPIDPKFLQHENPNNCQNLASPLPLDKYRLNVDPKPHVIRRKPLTKIAYSQKVAVR